MWPKPNIDTGGEITRFILRERPGKSRTAEQQVLRFLKSTARACYDVAPSRWNMRASISEAKDR